jgi:glycosyltransferase involved in cell wall biosynthesis
MQHKIAAIIPCYNEELTIKQVISDLTAFVPTAEIYVFDNNSTDKTVAIAREAGAKIIHERRQGKGYVVQSMFNKIKADIYVMVDGDNTYCLNELPRMINTIIEQQADMVIGTRLNQFTKRAFRKLHLFGNKLVRTLVNRLFQAELTDIMSGFRVMSKQFVKNIHIISPGFEVETEMTIKALKNGFQIKEVDVDYKERPHGSISKLNTFSDGWKVIKTLFIIFKDYKPLIFFSSTALLFAILAIVAGFPVILDYIHTRYINHLPLAIFASGTMIFAIILLVTGIILDSINKRFDELANCIKNRIED